MQRALPLLALLFLGAFSPVRAESGSTPAAEEQQADTATPAPLLIVPTRPSSLGAAEKSAVLAHLADPNSVKAAAAAKDEVPEPGTIGFGLAVLAIGLGKLAQSFARCWRTTSARPQ